MRERVLSRRQVREVDRIAVEDLGLPGAVLMENAGRGAVETMLGEGPLGRVLIACGKGNNAGDGYVVARHAELAGAEVRLVRAWRDDLPGDAGVHRHVWLAGGGGEQLWREDAAAALDRWRPQWVVDALLGTGASGPLRDPLPSLLATLNLLSGRKLALDVPTGLDCETGEAQEEAFRADITCTFVARKRGFQSEPAGRLLGRLVVVGIGAPEIAIERALREA